MISSDSNSAAANADGKAKTSNPAGTGNGTPVVASATAGQNYAFGAPPGRTTSAPPNLSRGPGDVPQQHQMYGYPGQPQMYMQGMTPQHPYYAQQRFMPVIPIQQPIHPNSPQMTGQKLGGSPTQQQRGPKGKKSGNQQQAGAQQAAFAGQQQAYRTQYPPQNYAQYQPHMYQQPPVMQYYPTHAQGVAPTHTQPVREKKILEIIDPRTNEVVTASPLKPAETAQQKENNTAARAQTEPQPQTPAEPKLNAAAEMLAQAKARLEKDKEDEEAKRKAEAVEKEKLEMKKREEEAERRMKQKAEEAAAARQKLEEDAKLEERKRKEREAKLRMEEMEMKRKQALAEQEAQAKANAKAKAEQEAQTADEKKEIAAPAVTSETKSAPIIHANMKDGKLVYSVVDLLSFKEKPECKTVPPALSPDKIDMINIINIPRSMQRSSSSGRGGNFDRNHHMNNRQFHGNMRGSQVGTGAGPQWSRGSQPPPRMHPNQKQGRGGTQGRPGVMQVNTMKVEPIKRSENAWKPGMAQSADALEKYLRSVTQILNKLSRENFDRLFLKLFNLEVSSVKMLEGLINLIRNKALTEPKFGDLYADLCKNLVERTQVKKDEPYENQFVWNFVNLVEEENQYYWTTSTDPEDEDYLKGPFPSEAAAKKDSLKGTELRRILLNQCQQEFEQEDKYAELEEDKKKLQQDLKTKSSSEDQNKIKMEIAEVDYKTNRLKQRILGNIQFIGELFKKQILTARVMLACITQLIGTRDGQENPIPDEENVECLCKLLTTVGKDLESRPEVVEGIFTVLKDYSVSKHLDARHRFMCKDVIELRENKWVARRKELKAKTKDEIRKDALQEEAQKIAESQAANARNQQYNRGRYNNMGRRDNRMGMGPVGSVMGSVATGTRMGSGYKIGGGSSRTLGSQDARFQSRKGAPPAQRQTPPGQRPIQSGGMSMRPGGSKTGPGFGRPGGGFRPGGLGNRSAGIKAPPAVRPGAGSGRTDEQPKKDIPKIDRSDMKRMLQETLKEYIQVQMEDELVNYLKHLEPKVESITEMKKLLVEECASFVIEKGAEERRYIPRAMVILLKAKFLTPTLITSALFEFNEFLPDMKLDAPLADKHLGNLLAELIIGEYLGLNSLPKMFEKLLDDEFNLPVALSTVGVTLGEIAKEKTGKDLVEKSGMSLADFFVGKASEEALAEISEKYNLDSLFPVNTKKEQLYLGKLIEEEADIDEILRWFQSDVSNQVLQDKEFARFLVCTVLEFIEVNKGVLVDDKSRTETPDTGVLEKENEQITKYSRLFKRVTKHEASGGNQNEVQVHCLSGIANFAHRYNYPPGMETRIFQLLYENEVVQEEAYIEWKGLGTHMNKESQEYAIHKETMIKLSDWLHWLEHASEESDGSSDS